MHTSFEIFLHLFFFTAVSKKLLILVTWLIELLPTRVKNLAGFLLRVRLGDLSPSFLPHFLSNLTIKLVVYTFVFLLWCFFIYHLPTYFIWLLKVILPFYFINLFSSYVTLISFLIKIFLLRSSGDVFYDFTFDLRRKMIEHLKNLLDCYLTITSGLHFSCIYDFFVIWGNFVTSKRNLVRFLQIIRVFVYWHYKLLTSTFIFITKNLILFMFLILILLGENLRLRNYRLFLRLYYITRRVDWLKDNFKAFCNVWTRYYPYRIKTNDNFSPYSFLYNTSLLLFAKVREVQVLYLDKEIVIINARRFKNLSPLTIPQGFSLKIYMYSAMEYELSDNGYAHYWFTRTSFTLTRNNFLGFKVLLSEHFLRDDYNPLPSLYKVNNNKKVRIFNYDDPERIEHLRIFNLRFNYALLNIFKLYLKEVLTVLTVNFKLTNFILVLNRDKCISWLDQDINLFVDNIDLLIYDKQRYFPRKPSFVEGVRLQV